MISTINNFLTNFLPFILLRKQINTPSCTLAETSALNVLTDKPPILISLENKCKFQVKNLHSKIEIDNVILRRSNFMLLLCTFPFPGDYKLTEMFINDRNLCKLDSTVIAFI